MKCKQARQQNGFVKRKEGSTILSQVPLYSIFGPFKTFTSIINEHNCELISS